MSKGNSYLKYWNNAVSNKVGEDDCEEDRNGVEVQVFIVTKYDEGNETR